MRSACPQLGGSSAARSAGRRRPRCPAGLARGGAWHCEGRPRRASQPQPVEVRLPVGSCRCSGPWQRSFCQPAAPPPPHNTAGQTSCMVTQGVALPWQGIQHTSSRATETVFKGGTYFQVWTPAWPRQAPASAVGSEGCRESPLGNCTTSAPAASKGGDVARMETWCSELLYRSICGQVIKRQRTSRRRMIR